MKTGPLTRDELMLVWAAACDSGYREPLQDAGDGAGLEVYSQHAAQLERVSQAVDKSTQALYILPHSGQTDQPASGGQKATVTLTVSRTINLQRPLVITAGSLIVAEETTDHSPSGPIVVQSGRRFITTGDLVFNPGEPGPFTVPAIAERIGTGYNNPRPNTLVRSVQVGANFTRPRASVTVPNPARGTIISANEADTFIPEHIGRTVLFTAGANAGLLAHLVAYLQSPDASNGVGSIVAFDDVHAVAGTIVGTFVASEQVNLAAGTGRVYAARNGRMTFQLLTGTAPVVGGVVTGVTSGATLTVTAILYGATYAAETGGATWRVLDWEADWGLVITNAASPTGGKHAVLDMLGDDRDLARVSGESDASYSIRVSTLADVVTPNALMRALSRSLGTLAWTFREVGSENLRGSFYDDVSDPDAYDGNVMLFDGTVSGTFDFQEACILEEVSTGSVAARGYVGSITGGIALTFITRPGYRAYAGGSWRVRGLHSGATFATTNVTIPASVDARRLRRNFDYEQFRAFFLVDVPDLGLGEFGFGYDVIGGPNNAYDVACLDGFPAGNASVYLRAYQALDQAKAGGVGFDFERRVTPFTPVILVTSAITSLDVPYSDTLGGSWRRATGTGFSAVTGASDVIIDPGGTNTPATAVVVESNSSMLIKMPLHAAGLVGISVRGSTLANAVKYWDPTVPGMPTWFGDRGGFSKYTFNGDANARHWVRRAGSFNIGGVPIDFRSVLALGARSDVTVDGLPFFGQDNGDPNASSVLIPRTTTDPPDTNVVTFNDLMGGASHLTGGAVFFAGYYEKIVTGGSQAFAGDGVLYDGGQNRNGLLLSNINKAGASQNVAKGMVYDGAFHAVEVPVPASGPIALAFVRDITTTPGTTFIKITADGTTWDGSAGTSAVGDQSGWDQIYFGKNSGGGAGNFHGIGGMLVFYNFQPTAQDVTDFYGWHQAEFVKIIYPDSDTPSAWFGDFGAGYAGPTLAANPSNGTSGGRLPLIVRPGGGSTAPTAGSLINGVAPMVFNGTSSAMVYQLVTSVSSVLPLDPGPFTIEVIGKLTSTVAAATNFQDDPAFFTDSLGNVGIVGTSSGIRGGLQTPQKNTPFIAQAAGSYFVAWLRYDAANLDLRVNQTDAASTPATAHSTFGAPLQLGANYNAAKYLAGEILGNRVIPRKLTPTEMATRYAQIKAKYPALSLP